MDQQPDKVIVTNVAALKGKYGANGYDAIKNSVDALISADKQRGLVTVFVPLDDKGVMKTLSAPPVTRPIDPAQNKEAIDAVYRALGPDYVVILGAIDIVPHQDMANPLLDPSGEDPDEYAYGDLPYACEAPYSRDAKDFIGPTRVVGRLPDVTGGTDPNYLAELLRVAAEYRPASLPSAKTYFAVTAQIWKKSTDLSVTNTFGAPAKVEDVPPRDYKWSTDQLQRHMHFFNCHGAPASSQFYGQPSTGASQYPPALDAAYIDGKLQEGTIVAAECCYGGELYPVSATQTQIGICNVYLANKAYGFFASTTIAYGPAEGNGQADLICQFFLQNILRGSSNGRAALEARQTFVRKSSPMDPTDLKTLAQFNLYGDPSLTPVQTPKAFVLAAATDYTIAERSDRKDRRRLLFREGIGLAAKEPVPTLVKRKPKKAILDRLHASAEAQGRTPGSVLSFSIRQRGRAKLPHALAQAPSLPTAFHLLFTKSLDDTSSSRAETGVVDILVFVGKEVDGELASITKIRSR
ncbi:MULTISPECIES: C25 family cysteine peptidase [Rhizobium]|uniref:C25 family cysteine peptidase n=1 Tax=Rhizobium aouanii TaxID=3118145 RepID=A0ABU8CL22_9HYPH|nr:C25 family cysteine peptidase [Rhizobium acaciae]MCW1410822.1 C25 family cysteine peptidase [Rhizobium acaciae]MCW1742879.1 C25 family cysteine peptidase [Rhizobium acaciae]MCW1750075.1 C25 family cysteine peptidase [Rhizobium acaciae]